MCDLISILDADVAPTPSAKKRSNLFILQQKYPSSADGPIIGPNRNLKFGKKAKTPALLWILAATIGTRVTSYLGLQFHLFI